jgi:hypothetical protein
LFFRYFFKKSYTTSLSTDLSFTMISTTTTRATGCPVGIGFYLHCVHVLLFSVLPDDPKAME